MSVASTPEAYSMGANDSGHAPSEKLVSPLLAPRLRRRKTPAACEGRAYFLPYLLAQAESVIFRDTMSNGTCHMAAWPKYEKRKSHTGSEDKWQLELFIFLCTYIYINIALIVVTREQSTEFQRIHERGVTNESPTGKSTDKCKVNTSNYTFQIEKSAPTHALFFFFFFYGDASAKSMWGL